MLATLRKLAILLTSRERRRGALVVLLMIAMAGFEVAGIASVMPFLTVMGDPGMIERNPYLSQAYGALGFESHRGFLIALALFGLGVLVVSTIVRLAAQFVMLRYAHMRRHSVSRRLLRGHLQQPYEYFLTRNTAELSRTILSEVDQLTQNVVIPAVHLVAYGCVVAAIVSFLVLIDPLVALVISASLGGFYALTYLALRGTLGRIGRERVDANGQRFKAANEALGGIQELKVLGREPAFFEAFDPASKRYARFLAAAELVSKLPKRVVELIGFAALLLAAIYLLESHRTLGQVLPILGAYAVAGHRLLPALQEVYQSVAKLRFGGPVIDTILSELNVVPPDDERANSRATEALQLNSTLEMRGVGYTYPGQSQPALSDVNLVVEAGAAVSIHGQTGAGKSTLVKVILSLLEPQSGQILIDGQPLDRSRQIRWQRAIGYVPQDMFMVDDTIARNVALGVPDAEIDRARLREAARKARIDTFIESRLPDGYDTVVGERGIRLSGGQRQRLAIARALYNRPSVVVLDEATSALDPATEAEIIQDLLGAGRDFTLIAITHRESVAQLCDRTFRVDGGTVTADAPAGAVSGSGSVG